MGVALGVATGAPERSRKPAWAWLLFGKLADSDLRGYTMAAQRQLRALVNDRNLQRFVVQARPTGRQLGTGSYGTVEEVDSSTEI